MWLHENTVEAAAVAMKKAEKWAKTKYRKKKTKRKSNPISMANKLSDCLTK